GRVFRRPGTEERERPGRGLHLVGRVDVVLDQDGNPVQRAAGALLLALLVEVGGDGQGVRVHLDDTVDGRPLAIDLVNPGEVLLGEGAGREGPGLESGLEVGEGRLTEFERLDVRGGRRAGGGRERGGRGAEEEFTAGRG